MRGWIAAGWDRWARSARRGRRRAAAAAGALLVLSACSRGSQPPIRRTTHPEPTVAVVPRTGPPETRLAVPYADASPTQTLDLYLPAGDGRSVFPLVVLIHGGGFLGGSSTDEADVAELLTSRGFAAASLNYRLSGEARFPAGVQDVKAALRFLHVTAPSIGVDPARIAVWGFSAGGYLASMIGATAALDVFGDPALGNESAPSTVAAVVSWFGPADFATMDEQARRAGCDEAAQQHHADGSPEARWLGGPLEKVGDLVRQADVTRYVAAARVEDLPPYYLVHGSSDCTVAPGQSEQLKAALEQRGARVRLTIVDGAGHADPMLSEQQTRPTIAFLREALGVGIEIGDPSPS